jgi:kynurenine formamidase
MLIDVSAKLENGVVFRYGSPPLEITTVACSDRNGGQYNTSVISTAVHVGTHIDVLDKNKVIDLKRFISRGILVNVNGILDRQITLQDMESVLPQIMEQDFVIFKTGWEQYLGQEKYEQHPELSLEVVQWLATKQVNMVGIDAPGIGRNKNHGLYDKFLIDRDILVVENLVNLSLINTNIFKVYCFPVSIAGLEAIPARIVVEI